jgi:hypothetical protein
MWTLLTPAWKWFWQPTGPKQSSRKQRRRPPTPTRQFTPRCEQLEDRVVMSVAAEEQLFIYELNRARHDPVAYQLERSLPVSLAGVAARPPLAVNNDLFDSTEFHAVDMAVDNYFAHNTPEGLTPNQMVRNEGYVLPGSYPTLGNNVESIAFGGGFPTSPTATAGQALEQLIIDEDTPSLGHRIQLLAMSEFAATHREIGVGHRAIDRFHPEHGLTFKEDYWAIHTAVSNASDKFLTGVVFNDVNANGRYDLNEGLGGVTITVGALNTTTNAAGGWSIKVAGTGSMDVTAAGNGVNSSATVSVGSDNIEVDFIRGTSTGIVNFDSPLPPAPNAAPLLNAAQNPTLANTVEDTVSAATLISTLVDTEVTDATGPEKGIAVISTTGTGNWQFSADGVNFFNFGTVSASSALLLPETYSLRFLPAADASGTASITYHAWDQSSGAAEAFVNLSATASRGGTTAFSTATDTISISIAAANDAPVLDNSGNPTLPTINEDTTAPANTLISTLLGASVSDVDASALEGIAVTDITGNGAWQFSINGGTTFVNFGAVSEGSALLLRGTDRIRFVPAANTNGEAAITFRAWDRTVGTAGLTGDASVNGDTTAFSDAQETTSVTVLPLNDAPVLAAGTSTFTSINVNNTTSAGDTVASLLGAAVTDADAAAQQGIAIIAQNATGGKWQYSTNGGASFLDLGTASASAARLLEGDDLVRFVPNLNFTIAQATSVKPSITFRAWDRTTGTAGATANITASGGATAFSSATRVASLIVNNAPVLNNSGNPTLAAINEDVTAPTNTTIAVLVGTAISDTGTGILKGVAVIGLTGNGTWQYSINGGTTFINFGTVTEATARLLRDTDRIRFVPAANFNGEATITFRAWDRTVGTAGLTGDASVNDGTTPFSAAVETASITISPRNDAPTLAPGTPTLAPVWVTDPNPAGNFISTLVGTSINDIDTGAVEGIAVIGVTGSANGRWEFSTDGGVNWTNFLTGGAPAATKARLLDDDHMIRFVPNPGFTMTTAASVKPTIVYRAWDQTSGTLGGTANITATGGTTAFSTTTQTASVRVNDAPVLTPAGPNLDATAIRTNSGITVATLLGNSVQDFGTGALEGIAVTGLTTTATGKWQYSINGGTTFLDFGTPTAETARLLRATDRIRFVAAGSVGTPTLTYRAWDQTTGAAGQIIDLTLPGALGQQSAFSAVLDTATLNVV